MQLRGQRFEVDFSDDEDERGTTSRMPIPSGPSIPSPLIGDIQERSPKPPSAPKLKNTPSGFPEHKKRSRISAFKQQRNPAPEPSVTPVSKPAAPYPAPQPAAEPTSLGRPAENDLSFEEKERLEIDKENRQRLAAMSVEEIEEERLELLSGLDPTLIEKLLKRANLDEGHGDAGTGEQGSYIEMLGKEEPIKPPHTEVRKETTVDATTTPAPKPEGKLVPPSKSVRFQDDETPVEPINLQPVSNKIPDLITPPAIHFPTAANAPDLDPSDPSFLENLHSKYFPSLPADPSKLAWMAPIPSHGSIADQESPYYPAKEALPASALRFDFRGALLPPRIARAMPASKGLHHHGEAPEAAGYTVPELARLARSAFPAQRCLAFQTLGRLLYRLGRGEFGEGSEITQGLWRSMDEGKVIQTLEEASSAEGGHQGSKNYAVEALWLWQRGGGKVWKSG
ncbi:hypothetical protein B7463_g5516, partial [Scytalidium lignicola]